MLNQDEAAAPPVTRCHRSRRNVVSKCDRSKEAHMRVFLAGATGAIGKRLVPLLVANGHAVTGTTRSPEKAERLRAAGAEPVVVDVLDESAVVNAVTRAEPEVVVHEAT